jgi:hypothetical protein
MYTSYSEVLQVIEAVKCGSICVCLPQKEPQQLEGSSLSRGIENINISCHPVTVKKRSDE